MLETERTFIAGRTGSPLQQLAGRQLERDDQLEAQEHVGHYHPLLAHAEEMETAAGQLRLELSHYDARGNIRLELARYLEQVVLPQTSEPRIRALPEKLRQARRKCWFQLDTDSGNTRTLWEHKAGEPLLCPDDAREEAMRLQRRLEDEIVDLKRRGYRVYYGVLTIDNAPPGGLRGRIDSLWTKWRRAIKARVPNNPGERIRAKDRKRLFPLVGSIATLEAPLGASRTWHPHLNVIAITRGFFDWEKWWAHWNCVSHWEEIAGTPEAVAAAFRELVKYSVRAVPEKSAAKKAMSTPRGEACALNETHTGGRNPCCDEVGDRPAPPAMTEWSASEWLEWWGAMKGRRRTRTYGELFGLNVEPDREEEGSWVTFGRATWAGGRYRAWFPLLESIPGDKSIRDLKHRREKFLADLTGPPQDWAQLASDLEQIRQAEAFEALKAMETGGH